ncbi:MAG TPA: hypothetical protein VM943_01600 [Pyrinomonadaceae bacterium]|nr:hypothetical protein [Pyrinomonadaceae bacterium]
MPALVDTVLNTDRFGAYFGWVGYGFQPLARFVVGAWLWQAGEVALVKESARESAKRGEEVLNRSDA